ncbi:MAG: xanthine dehydrogenase family protein subunit M [bacterium]|nr:xanthine dehydrogenase family protein subunit M [bacterium]
MNQLIYLIPRTLEETLKYLGEYRTEATILAGGTDIAIELRESKLAAGRVRIFYPKKIIDISQIQELKGIIETGEYIQLGALVTQREIAESDLINKYGNILAEAARRMGSPQVRNRGTLGGNLGTASPAADTAPPLIALEATVILKSLTGHREVPIEDFFFAPGKTILQPDELILGVRFPKMKKNESGRYYKIGQRNAVSISIVAIAIKAELDKNRFGKVRIGLGSVAPKPIRAIEAERILFNQPFNATIINQSAEAALSRCSTITDIRASGEYRCRMVKELTRTLLIDIANNFNSRG